MSGMELKNIRKTNTMTREQERAVSRRFGRHVSREKALCTLLATTFVCLLPILLGRRLWEQIPPVVQTGLISAEGKDDSMPRAVLVYGVPGLFCLMNLICHAQLWLHQKAERLPPASIRLIGRWGIPVLSLPLCRFWMLRAAGETAVLQGFVPSLFALFLLLLGAHFFDCPRGARLAFRFRNILYSDKAWRAVHRAAGISWMLAGLLLPALEFSLSRIPSLSAVPILLLLLLPLPASFVFREKT